MERREAIKLAAASAIGASLPMRGVVAQVSPRLHDDTTWGWSENFGATSLTLGPPGRQHALVVRRFLRAGGFDSVTPTLARVWWDAASLHVAFENTEPDPRYRGNPGLAKPDHYPGTGRFDLASWPDAVYVQYRGGWRSEDTVQVFAVDSSGAQNAVGYRTEARRANGIWTAQFELPWSLLGERPVDHAFGLNLVRSRGQSSEVLSPVALDQSLTVSSDLLIWARFGERPACDIRTGVLCALPDGSHRWQLPARPQPPTAEQMESLWQQQRELAAPTRPENLSERVALAQRLHELLVLEGFSFHTDGANWRVLPGEYYPREPRAAVNRALCAGTLPAACAVLDVFLHQLDRAVQGWFADGSPGNVSHEQWLPAIAAGTAERDGDELRLPLRAGSKRLSIWVSLASGGVRMRGPRNGFFQPSSVKFPEPSVDLRVRIENDPWKIAVIDSEGRERWSLAQGQLHLLIAEGGEIKAMDVRRRLLPDEDLYGFGERFNALGQRGRVVTLWDEDCWDGLIHGQLNQAYKNVPLMHSTAGSSLFWNSSYRLRADIGCTRSGELRLTMAGDVLDLFVWPGPPTTAMAGYTELTGAPMVPPRWAFEPWMGGGGRRWKNGPLKDPVSEELHVMEQFRALDIPHSAIYAEAGNADPRLYAGFATDNLHVLAWVYAAMKLERVRELLPGVPDGELPIVHHRNGSMAFRHDDGAAIIDYTHPRVAELLQRFWAPRFALGLSGSMVDFGDVVPEDAVFFNGKSGAEMHNFYAHFYHRAYRDAFRAVRGENYVLFARSACTGDQASIGYFAGDHQANFFGMRGALRGGLNAASCGLSTWGADAGGYAGWPDPETYIRWIEWAAFCPLMRFHGTTPREPWEFGEAAVGIYRKYAWLRESLLLYIAAMASRARETGVSMMRPMMFAYPDSPLLRGSDDQYMFGDHLLIAPVLRPGDHRPVRLPPGVWTDLWTGRPFTGNRVIELDTPLDTIGVLLAPGAALRMELPPSLVPGESMTSGRVRALLTTPPDRGRTWNVDTSGVDVLIRFVGGKRVVTNVQGVSHTATRSAAATIKDGTHE
jgi:alpha-glucosidase (family GH31 glycosyl hydrolase)